jgi:hypothetical protein
VVGTLRREAPPGRGAGAEGRAPWTVANPGAYRTEIGGGGRRLRLKQFLYDWAFPAADQPALWRSETRAEVLPEGRVLWFGTDYLDHVAASARMSRTMVELSVLEGEFSRAELSALYRSLRPADPAAAERVLRTPFAALSYWARHEVDAVVVATGLFHFRRGGTGPDGVFVAASELPSFLREHRLPVVLGGGFAAESAALYAEGREVEVGYVDPTADGRELRLMVQPTGAGRLVFPPEREPHPARTLSTGVLGYRVELAYVDQELGACDAVWQAPEIGLEGRLLSCSGVGMGAGFVLDCVREVLAAAERVDGVDEVAA